MVFFELKLIECCFKFMLLNTDFSIRIRHDVIDLWDEKMSVLMVQVHSDSHETVNLNSTPIKSDIHGFWFECNVDVFYCNHSNGC